MKHSWCPLPDVSELELHITINNLSVMYDTSVEWSNQRVKNKSKKKKTEQNQIPSWTSNFAPDATQIITEKQT